MRGACFTSATQTDFAASVYPAALRQHEQVQQVSTQRVQRTNHRVRPTISRPYRARAACAGERGFSCWCSPGFRRTPVPTTAKRGLGTDLPPPSVCARRSTDAFPQTALDMTISAWPMPAKLTITEPLPLPELIRA